MQLTEVAFWVGVLFSGICVGTLLMVIFKRRTSTEDRVLNIIATVAAAGIGFFFFRESGISVVEQLQHLLP